MELLEHSLAVYAAHFARIFCLLAVIRPLRANTGHLSFFALSAALALWQCGELPNAAPASGMEAPGVVVCLREACLGFAVGLPLALAAEAPVMAGRIVDALRAAQFSEQLLPGSGGRASSLEQVGLLVVGLYIFCGNGWRDIAALIDHSFLVLPAAAQSNAAGCALLSGIPLVELLNISRHSLYAAVLFGAPCLIACLAADVGVALLSRSLGRVNMVFEALPIKVVGGLLVMWLALRVSGAGPVNEIPGFGLGAAAGAVSSIDAESNTEAANG